MRIWLACFGVLFAIAELYQWMKHLTLPLPIQILAGVGLVIASNHNKLMRLPGTDPELPPTIVAADPPACRLEEERRS